VHFGPGSLLHIGMVKLQELCALHTHRLIMPTANSSASKEVVTAALLVISGRILSGRTKDQNIGYIAEYLTALGINLKEVRVAIAPTVRLGSFDTLPVAASPYRTAPEGSSFTSRTAPRTRTALVTHDPERTSVNLSRQSAGGPQPY